MLRRGPPTAVRDGQRSRGFSLPPRHMNWHLAALVPGGVGREGAPVRMRAHGKKSGGAQGGSGPAREGEREGCGEVWRGVECCGRRCRPWAGLGRCVSFCELRAGNGDWGEREGEGERGPGEKEGGAGGGLATPAPVVAAAPASLPLHPWSRGRVAVPVPAVAAVFLARCCGPFPLPLTRRPSSSSLLAGCLTVADGLPCTQP